jgi:hypothetical protein
MVAPTRFPAGISTFKTNQILNTFPTLPASNQYLALNPEFFPYLASMYTVTNTTATIAAGLQSAGGTSSAGLNGSLLSLAVTTAAGGKAAISLNGNVGSPYNGNNVQFIPGNQVWFNTQVAHNSTFLTDATAVSRYGLFDLSDPTGTILNGVYFEKVAAAGGALNLVIKNTGLTGATVTTTINNVADISKPSGIYGDTSSTVGTLTTAGSANKYTSVAVATSGSGYVQAPIVRTTGASGAYPFAQIYAQVQNGALYAPYIAHVGGTGYTTFTNEVNHWIDLSLYYDGKGRLFVGVNGKQVASIGMDGVTSLSAGGTATTGNSFYAVNSSMTTSIAPVLPAPGSFDNIMPMSALSAGVGYALNTAATNIMFIDQIAVASEYN